MVAIAVVSCVMGLAVFLGMMAEAIGGIIDACTSPTKRNGRRDRRVD
jgi:hypothetical protein